MLVLEGEVALPRVNQAEMGEERVWKPATRPSPEYFHPNPSSTPTHLGRILLPPAGAKAWLCWEPSGAALSWAGRAESEGRQELSEGSWSRPCVVASSSGPGLGEDEAMRTKIPTEKILLKEPSLSDSFLTGHPAYISRNRGQANYPLILPCRNGEKKSTHIGKRNRSRAPYEKEIFWPLLWKQIIRRSTKSRAALVRALNPSTWEAKAVGFL